MQILSLYQDGKKKTVLKIRTSEVISPQTLRSIKDIKITLSKYVSNTQIIQSVGRKHILQNPQLIQQIGTAEYEASFEDMKTEVKANPGFYT